MIVENARRPPAATPVNGLPLRAAGTCLQRHFRTHKQAFGRFGIGEARLQFENTRGRNSGKARSARIVTNKLGVQGCGQERERYLHRNEQTDIKKRSPLTLPLKFAARREIGG